MNKKNLAVILELIPIISAVAAFVLIRLPGDSDARSTVTAVTFFLAFFGFVFFFIGRRFARGDRAVRILGIFDWAATLSIIGFYILVIFVFGL